MIHFKKVLNNHEPTNDTVIQDIGLREVMNELYTCPTWNEFIQAVTELTYNKALGLNRVPPKMLKP